MPSLIDVKPIGAFIEYTLKPLLDDSREVLELLEANGFTKEDVSKVVWLFVLERMIGLVNSIFVTGIICFTIFRILSHSQITHL